MPRQSIHWNNGSTPQKVRTIADCATADALVGGAGTIQKQSQRYFEPPATPEEETRLAKIEHKVCSCARTSMFSSLLCCADSCSVISLRSWSFCKSCGIDQRTASLMAAALPVSHPLAAVPRSGPRIAHSWKTSGCRSGCSWKRRSESWPSAK